MVIYIYMIDNKLYLSLIEPVIIKSINNNGEYVYMNACSGVYNDNIQLNVHNPTYSPLISKLMKLPALERIIKVKIKL